MTTLLKYEAACAALEAAVTADEVMRVHVTAAGIEVVARMAGDFENELKATKLRTNAATRLGDMIIEGEAKGIIAAHGGKGRRKPDQDGARDLDPKPATLREIGVSNRLSSRARKLSGIGAKAVAAMLERMESESRKRGLVAHNVIHETLASRNAKSRRQLAQELSDCAALQPCGRKFPVVYGDPAWRRKAGIGNRAYENTYVTMSWDDILAMPVAQRVLADAWLFLWIPRPHLMALHPVLIPFEGDDTPGAGIEVEMPLAWAVARAWGFDNYSTCFIWTKTDDEHPDDHGSGLIVWDQDEILCLFKRGQGLPMPSGAEKVGSNHRERAGKHSAKPAYYRDMINRMTGGVPVLELFAREDDEHPLPANFFTWGNQSKNTAEQLADDGSATDPTTGEITEAVDAPTQAAESPYRSPLVDPDDPLLDIPPFLRKKREEVEA